MNYKDYLKQAGIDPEDVGEPHGFTSEIVEDCRRYNKKKKAIDLSNKL